MLRMLGNIAGFRDKEKDATDLTLDQLLYYANINVNKSLKPEGRSIEKTIRQLYAKNALTQAIFDKLMSRTQASLNPNESQNIANRVLTLKKAGLFTESNINIVLDNFLDRVEYLAPMQEAGILNQDYFDFIAKHKNQFHLPDALIVMHKAGLLDENVSKKNLQSLDAHPNNYLIIKELHHCKLLNQVNFDKLVPMDERLNSVIALGLSYIAKEEFATQDTLETLIIGAENIPELHEMLRCLVLISRLNQSNFDLLINRVMTHLKSIPEHKHADCANKIKSLLFYLQQELNYEKISLANMLEQLPHIDRLYTTMQYIIVEGIPLYNVKKLFEVVPSLSDSAQRDMHHVLERLRSAKLLYRPQGEVNVNHVYNHLAQIRPLLNVITELSCYTLLDQHNVDLIIANIDKVQVIAAALQSFQGETLTQAEFETIVTNAHIATAEVIARPSNASLFAQSVAKEPSSSTESMRAEMQDTPRVSL